METNSFDVLAELIEKIINFYDACTKQWLEEHNSFNTKRKEIRDVNENIDLLNIVTDFREFMNEKSFEFYSMIPEFQNRNIKVTCRVKDYNSLLYKVDTYMNKIDRSGGKLEGKITINKSLNDLFGMRIIMPEEFIHTDLAEFINTKFPNLKIIDSTKNGYYASHIYFMYNGGKMFPWELQVWYSGNEESNLVSHEKYKQGYTVWEEKFKEGGV